MAFSFQDEPVMPFIRLYPLQETQPLRLEDFGYGNPARCHAMPRFGARELWLNLQHILAYEECPLYLVCAAEPNGLVNGIRLRLTDGTMLVVADDPEDDDLSFASALEQAASGRMAETGYSRYLGELARRKLI